MRITERKLRSIIRSVIRESSERLPLLRGNPFDRFPEFVEENVIEQYRKDIVSHYMNSHQLIEPLEWLEKNIPNLNTDFLSHDISSMTKRLETEVLDKFTSSPTYLNKNG